MRLFIAIGIPDEIKGSITRIQEAIGDDFVNVRWVSKEQMHLTLKFLGEVQDNNLISIKNNLNKIKFDRFKLCLDSIDVFPNEDYIRVLWVGLKPEDKVINLQKSIDESLRDLFEREKNFKAHITLGRVKDISNIQKFKGRLKKIEIGSKEFRVDSFSLVKSILTNGVVHEDLEKFCAQ